MLKQNLSFRLSQKLSPQQIQLMKLIQLPTQAFEQKLAQEVDENPALESGKEEKEEEDDFSNQEDEYNDEQEVNIEEYINDDEIPTYRTQANNYSADDDDKTIPYAAGKSFHQHLKSQLNTFMLDEKERQIADFLVGSINDRGYIRREVIDIVDDLAFTDNVYTDEAEVERILINTIQELDPSGVGARDLNECLLIQLKRKKEKPARVLAIKMLEQSFDSFAKKHYKKIIKKFSITETELKEAIAQISKLNPKPGGVFVGNTKVIEQIVPDFTIQIIEDELDLTLNSRNAPQLHVSPQYNDMLKGYSATKKKSKQQKEAVLFIKQKLDSAKWFIEAIKQRQQTLMLTMSSIMHHQEKYLLSGDERDLKPMILKDIADKISMDVSTISRVANSKYVDTPYGTKLVKFFFSESMKNADGEDVSTKEIKKILETIILAESKKKPLTDQKLSEFLKEKGYPVARRTVAKYREQLSFPVARLRKEI